MDSFDNGAAQSTFKPLALHPIGDPSGIRATDDYGTSSTSITLSKPLNPELPLC